MGADRYAERTLTASNLRGNQRGKSADRELLVRAATVSCETLSNHRTTAMAREITPGEAPPDALPITPTSPCLRR